MLIKQLSLYILNKDFVNKAAQALLALVLLTAFGCGKRKPPLPPIERVAQRVEITGYQQGSIVNLSWTLPARNASESSLLNIDKIEIYRLAEPIGSTTALTEEEFAARSTLIASVPVSETDFARRQLNYQDSLDFAGQAVRLHYAIRFVNDSGQRASFSNFLLVEPTAKIASSPSLLNATAAQEAILLAWVAPETNVDGSKPANVLGFNIYRKSNEVDRPRLLNNTPVTKTEFADIFFEFEQPYTYFVRAVSLGTDGAPVESLNSNVIVITPADTFPPSAPNAITIAAAPNNLSIFFAVNPEKDVVGYRIYRSADKNLPASQWRLLNQELLTTNTFQDTNIESGKTYYYYLKAVDKAGNVSEPSEVVSETAP